MTGTRAAWGQDNRNWIGNDIKFHHILLEACGSVWLEKVFQGLAANVARRRQ
jgi:hypothetical protein